MTVHGGTNDSVFPQTSARAVANYKQHGGFAINCDTGGSTCGGAPLAPDIWNFFKAHPFGVTPDPWSGGLPLGFSDLCSIQ
jgi:hypothetical protein